jgi:decaprenyl-phosphate phosphoribosyltransferase
MVWLKLFRPKQWAKNVLVFAAPGAAGVLGEGESLALTLLAFACFCMAASGTYCWNDALDADEDRLHPTKCHRPIASGAITPRAAMVVGTVLLGAAVGLSFVANWHLAAVIGGYVVLTVTYSAWLKHEPVIDIAAVAAGFLLRTIAGGFAVDVEISTLFLIVAGAGSLFMVTGKRHAELLELGDGAHAHRQALAHYSLGYLAYVRSVASSVAIVAYSLWAFDVSERAGNEVLFQLSIVPFVLGLLRYALLLETGKGGAPEEVVLSDRVLQLIGFVWVVCFGLGVLGH